MANEYMLSVEPTAENNTLSQDFDDFIDLEEIAALGLDKDSIPESDLTKEQAEFYLKRYKELREEKEEIEKLHDEKIKTFTKNADKWLEDRLRPITGTMEFYASALENYAVTNPPRSGKTIKMFEGSLSFSKQVPEYHKEEDKLRNFLAASPDGQKYLEPVPEKIIWNALKKDGELIDNIFKLNGETVYGVTVSIRPDKFVIK